jgi:sortase (surface protein transpeptidase)
MYKGVRKDLANPEFNRILLLRTIGNFLVLLSIFLVVKTFYQPVKEEVRFFVERISGKKYVVAEKSEEKGRLSQFLKGQNIEIITPKDPNFSIVIPKIAANANVIADVNPANEKEYLAALKKGVAHTLGTAYPGEGGHIFMFAHSTDYFWNVGAYNAVFYLLYKLEKGDEVDLFYKGARYVC